MMKKSENQGDDFYNDFTVEEIKRISITPAHLMIGQGDGVYGGGGLGNGG